MKETLLVVEDNQILLEGLRDILSIEGFNVVIATNGKEALDQMGTFIPDMIISDISMPVMDGFTFFQNVRSRQDWLTIPFLFLTARGDRQDVLAGKNLGAEDYLVKPLSRDELLTAVRSRLMRSNELRMAQLQQAYEASLSVLANAIDLRDPYTRGHIERVTAYSLAIAEQLGWHGRKLEELRFGAILHDIGKIFIQEGMLFKPKPLCESDWNEIKRHPVAGAEMIKDVPFLVTAVPIVRYHHEHWDGSGYPSGLAGAEIPFSARVVAVADSFDAMTSNRPYRKARLPEEAYRELLKHSGTQFDPQVVAAFQRAYNEGAILPVWKNWQNGNQSSPEAGSSA